MHKLPGDPRIVILDNSPWDAELRHEYIARQSDYNPGVFLDKEAASEWIHRSPIVFLVLFPLLFAMALRCVFWKRNRTNHALHILMIAENVGLMHYLRSCQPSVVFHFMTCLIDNNWLYLLLKPTANEYYRMTSPYALYTHNRITLSDRLVLTLDYHFEELNVYDTIRYTTLYKLAPESAFSFIDKYKAEKLTEPQPNTLGYYSHGSWARVSLDRPSDGMNIKRAEEKALEYIRRLTDLNPDVKVFIYLHPKEKALFHNEELTRYYTDQLGEKNFTFIDPSLKGTDAFELVNVGVAVFTSIMYERLYAGYKTLICSDGVSNFPLPGSALEGISFDTAEGLERLWKQSADLSRPAFFSTFEVSGYHYQSYTTRLKPIA